MTPEYERDHILEETLAHESSHTSLDEMHAASDGCLAAQKADDTFISTYARDNPTSEDVAESLVPWLAVRLHPSRVLADIRAKIEQAIPDRLAYFDAQHFSLVPQKTSR